MVLQNLINPSRPLTSADTFSALALTSHPQAPALPRNPGTYLVYTLTETEDNINLRS